MVKIACFFTGGFTESGAMQSFLQKINENIVMKQFCPNKPLRRRIPGVQPQMIKKVNGLTGESLISYIYNYIRNYPDELELFDAILIEDDLDGRFTREIVEGDEATKISAKTDEFIQNCEKIKNEVRNRLGRENFPVLFFWAAPEIETWFIADWAHSFGRVYGPTETNILTGEENKFFSARFQPYVRTNVLKEYQNQIEHYGYFEGKYKKLSDELIEALGGDFKVALGQDKTALAQKVSIMKELNYSKQKHGDLMLKTLQPEAVKRNCPIYFAEAYEQLRALQ